MPTVLHWGADLPPLGEAEAVGLAEAGAPIVANNSVDDPVQFGEVDRLAPHPSLDELRRRHRQFE